MRFLVFNIVVAGALIYLVANNDDGKIDLPSLDDISWQAEQALDRVSAEVPRLKSDAPAPAEKPENPFSVVPQSDTAASPPPAEEPLFDAPVIDKEDLPPPAAEPAPTPLPEPVRRVARLPVADAAPAPAAAPLEQVARTPLAEAPPPPPPLAADVAQRRAEVLGEAPLTSLAPVQPDADRRRQLLDLAEEMEFLAAEFAVR